jgi:hypothetical protein
MSYWFTITPLVYILFFYKGVEVGVGSFKNLRVGVGAFVYRLHSPGNEYQQYFLGGKGGWCVGLTTLPPSCAECLEICEPEPPGTLRAWPGLYRDCFTLFICAFSVCLRITCFRRTNRIKPIIPAKESNSIPGHTLCASSRSRSIAVLHKHSSYAIPLSSGEPHTVQ